MAMPGEEEAWNWSRKVSSARWFQTTEASLITGSWDACGCDQQNKVAVWDYAADERGEVAWRLQCEATMCGDVADVLPTESNGVRRGIVACSSSGRVRRFELPEPGCDELLELPDVHKPHTAPATSVHTFGTQLASAAEDGSIFLSDLAVGGPGGVRDLRPAGEAPVNAVHFRGADQLLAVGSCPSAHLQLWDTRSGAVAQRFCDEGAAVSYQCVECYGMNVSCGTADGSAVLWDLRAPRERMFAAKIHRGAVRDMRRYGSKSLLTCGDDGRVIASTFGDGEKFDVKYGSQAQRAPPQYLSDFGALKSSTVVGWEGIGAEADFPMNSLDVHSRSNAVVGASDGRFFVTLASGGQGLANFAR